VEATRRTPTLRFARAPRGAGRSKKPNRGGESVRQLLGRAVEANPAKLIEMGGENGELWKNREAGRKRQRTGSNLRRRRLTSPAPQLALISRSSLATPLSERKGACGEAGKRKG